MGSLVGCNSDSDKNIDEQIVEINEETIEDNNKKEKEKFDINNINKDEYEEGREWIRSERDSYNLDSEYLNALHFTNSYFNCVNILIRISDKSEISSIKIEAFEDKPSFYYGAIQEILSWDDNFSDEIIYSKENILGDNYEDFKQYYNAQIQDCKEGKKILKKISDEFDGKSKNNYFSDESDYKSIIDSYSTINQIIDEKIKEVQVDYLNN